MKYKVGDKIKIVRATFGCCGAEGKIGVITNKPAIYGLIYCKDGFNVDCGDEHVWRIGFDSECELLGELTAEEAIKALGDMCARGCIDCKLRKLVRESKHAFCSDYRREHPDKVVEILKQYKKDHEKKEIEVTQKIYCLVVDEERKVVHEEEIGNSDSCMDVLKNYCENHDGKFFSLMEFRYEVKQ